MLSGYQHGNIMTVIWIEEECMTTYRGAVDKGKWCVSAWMCVCVCVKVYMSLPLLSLFSHKQISSFENEWANVSKLVYLITYAHSDPHTHTYKWVLVAW